jgi:hypothetical protein
LADLADEDREDVQKWCKELRGWRRDKFFSRTAGIELSPGDTLYMLRTDSEIRLMFRATAREVTIAEIVPSESVGRRMRSTARKSRKLKIAHAT